MQNIANFKKYFHSHVLSLFIMSFLLTNTAPLRRICFFLYFGILCVSYYHRKYFYMAVCHGCDLRYLLVYELCVNYYDSNSSLFVRMEAIKKNIHPVKNNLLKVFLRCIVIFSLHIVHNFDVYFSK